jgi:hypothetical protein
VIVRAFLVLAKHQTTGRVSARKVTRHYPALDWNEAVIALELDVPEDVFDAPLFTVEVGKRQVQVAVEALEVEEP